MRAPRSILAALLVVGAVLAAYSGALRLDFVDFDDPFFVLFNPTVNGGLTREGVVLAITRPHHLQWQPVAWISHMLDVELYGMIPRGHHATSVLLHAVNSLLVLWLGARLAGRLAPGLIAALLFAVHPLHVESVAWISSRKDLLSLGFSLGAMLFYLSALRRGLPSGRTLLSRPGRYAPVALCLALALAAKPMAVTVPALLLLLDLWPLGRLRGGPPPARPDAPPGERLGLSALLFEKLPLFALSAGAALVVNALVGAAEIGLGARLVNSVVAYALYVRRWLWPSDLCAFYPQPALSVAGGWSALAVGASALVLVAMLAVLVHGARRAPWRALGILWFLGALVPMIGLRHISGHAMADRYTYLPLVGLHLALGFELARLRPPLRLVAFGALGVALVLLGRVTRAQVATWSGPESLWRRALSVTEHNWTAHCNLGRFLLSQGRVEESLAELEAGAAARPSIAEPLVNIGLAEAMRGRLDLALEAFDEALAREPGEPTILTNRASVLIELGRVEEAEAELARALEGDPDCAAAWNLRGMIAERRGDSAGALLAFERTVVLDPEDAEGNANLGRTLFALGKYGRATDHLRRALDLRPDLVEARVNFALMLEAQGRVAEALADFELALTQNPRLPVARDHAAALRATMGDSLGQLAHLDALAELQPEDAGVQHERGLALEALGRVDEAQAAYRRATELDANLPESWNNLAGVLWRLGRIDEALEAYERALSLEPPLAQAASNYALLCDTLGRRADAVRWHRRAVELEPELWTSVVALARLLAGAPEDELRDGPEAVRLAERAVRADGERDPWRLATLAAALAEVGRFEEAAQWQERALTRLPEGERGSAAEALALYRAGKPWRARGQAERDR